MKKYSSIIIGSGFSGIAMGIKLKERGIHDFIILEKANDVGGTWRENTYPGAECDIPSALYSYSFEQYPDWEYKWSMQPQILKYLQLVGKKYQLFDHIQFGKELTDAKWNQKESAWNIGTRDGSHYTTKTLVSAVGQLHHPSIPPFKGKEEFAGPSFHSAQWDHTVSLEGKSVAVIGNAASAVQFIPEIAKTAKSVTIFQRSANWMLAKQDRAYSSWEKNILRRFPSLMSIGRLRIWLLGGALFFMMKKKNNFLRKIYERKSKSYIKKHIKDQTLYEKLIPTYPLGAKRLLFSDTYYPSLAQDHVEVITENITSITSTGVKLTNGSDNEVDVLIYATGFKTNPFLMGLDIQGLDGITIKEAWKDGPRNYLGITTSKFPNFFMMYGPNTNLGHNSIVIMSEAQANYIAQCISELEKRNESVMEVKQVVMENYYDKIQSRLKHMVWTSIEASWYQDANGNQPNNYPGRTMEYMRKTKKVDFNDFQFS